MLAHLSVLLNLVTGFLGPVAALIIYLVYRNRSRTVAFHAMQSFVMQLFLWYGGMLLTGIAWAITGALAVVIVGICLIPVALVITLLPLVALAYGLYGAIEVNQGKDFRYYWIGDWLDKTNL